MMIMMGLFGILGIAAYDDLGRRLVLVLLLSARRSSPKGKATLDN